MNRKSRVLSTRRQRPWRRDSGTAGLPKRIFRRQLTAEQVDEIYASAIDKIRCSIREKVSTLPPGSANRALLEQLQHLPPEKAFDELLSRSYPNPERVGCPPYRVLMELGTRTRSLDDPGHEHIAHCHPCSAELRTLVRSYMPPDPS
jgi:hypothetical protein